MKNSIAYIRYMTIAAFSIGLLMAILDIYNSWSEHAMTPEAPFLNTTLGFICFTFFIRAFTHREREKTLFKIRGMEYRVGNSNLVTCGLFFGVLVFAVTNPIKWIEITHLIFTGLAITSAYIEIIFYYKKERGPIFYASILSAIVGSGLFLMGFLFKTYSVATAEVFAALPIAIHILKTNKK